MGSTRVLVRHFGIRSRIGLGLGGPAVAVLLRARKLGSGSRGGGSCGGSSEVIDVGGGECRVGRGSDGQEICVDGRGGSDTSNSSSSSNNTSRRRSGSGSVWWRS